MRQTTPAAADDISGGQPHQLPHLQHSRRCGCTRHRPAATAADCTSCCEGPAWGPGAGRSALAGEGRGGGSGGSAGEACRSEPVVALEQSATTQV